jgi:hypothetical protein
MRHMSRVFSASPWRTKLIRVLATQLVFVLAAIAMAAVGGCASLGAKPWEHDLLAEPAMRMDAYPLQSAVVADEIETAASQTGVDPRDVPGPSQSASVSDQAKTRAT